MVKQSAPSHLPPVSFSLLGLSPEEQRALAPIAAQILADPVALRRLTLRVLELMRADLRIHQERYRGSGR